VPELRQSKADAAWGGLQADRTEPGEWGTNGQAILRTEQEVKWERISCVRCGAQCERIDERIPRLQEQIENLELELALATGRLVPENRLPC
jgi:hypothetical protein